MCVAGIVCCVLDVCRWIHIHICIKVSHTLDFISDSLCYDGTISGILLSLFDNLNVRWC